MRSSKKILEEWDERPGIGFGCTERRAHRSLIELLCDIRQQLIKLNDAKRGK